MRWSTTWVLAILSLVLVVNAFAAASVSFHNKTSIRPSLGASATASPNPAIMGQAVSFTCTAIGGVSPYDYSWDFGDGTSGTGSTTTHTYNNLGTYSVVCTVTDSQTTTARATIPLIVA
jgi:PKD repeat protein